MTAGMFRTLYAYQVHVTNRLLAGAARLTDDEYSEIPGYGHGSIHELFFHVLRTLVAWRTALETGTQPPGLDGEFFPDLASLREGFAREQGEWDRLLTQLSDDQIADMVVLTSRRGDRFPIARWRVLQHLLLHGMQHQTEIAALLTAKGQSPGDIDFIFYNG
jgi:uncharacterized damage-inducible protein DinB